MSVEELFGRTLGGNSAERRYIIKGESSQADALAALLADAPTTYNSIGRNTLGASVTETDEDGVYEGRVPYGGSSGARLALGETRIEFNISSQQTQITHSLNTEHGHSITGAVTDRKKAIGETADGTVEGTSILTPSVDFVIKKVVASSSVNSTLLDNIISVRTNSPVNNSAFSHADTDGRRVDLAAGEGLFLGMSNAALGDGTDELAFNFAASKNLTGISIGDMTGIAKDGWEYLWVYYRREADDTAKTVPLRPAEAYVEKVYGTGSWAGLGL